MNYLTDQDILDGCIAGNRGAREAFVRRFSDFVYRSIQHALTAKDISFNRADLEDLHNTIFVRLLDKRCKKLRQYKGKRGCSLLSWIRLITVRTIIDNLRKTNTDVLTRKGQALFLESLADIKGEEPEPWVLMDRDVQVRLVREGLRSLQPRDRLLLKLHFIKELPLQKVAGIMSISEGNAHTIKHRAIKRLQNIISNINKL